AGLLVESHHKLVVAAIKVHDEQIAVENRRRACPAEMIADEVPSGPKHFPCPRVQTSRARGAEGDVHPALFNDGCWRGVSIELVSELRLFNGKEHQIVPHFSSIAPETDRVQTRPILGSSRHPYLVTPDHWR